MGNKILLLGSTGKMGAAISHVFSDNYTVVGKNSADFDAADLDSVQEVIDAINPDIVINCVAFLGIDPCEENKEKAIMLNATYPKLLATLSKEKGFLLVHFSTDAVFNDEKNDFYTESDAPSPLNVYGETKYKGDCFVRALAERYYIIRISVLFGETVKQTQFVEKMLKRIEDGQKTLRISNDIISSPSYSRDIAEGIKEVVENEQPFGLYHMANQGKASLYDLMKEIVENLNLGVNIEAASFRDFSYVGKKNTFTPIKSEKIKDLRPWREAVLEYCKNL